MAKIIVIGLGAMGGAAAFYCQARGYEVLGFDTFPIGHNRGSSHGQSRIIRKAYYEAPDYVPLLHRAYDNWNKLSNRIGKNLIEQTGGIYIGAPECALVAGSLKSCKEHDLRYEMLSAEQVRKRFPFNPPDESVALYEEDAGILRPEECVRSYLVEAAKLGADLRFGEKILEYKPSEKGVRVQTNDATYEADRLIITAGPWAGEVMADLKLPLTVRRVVNAHFKPVNETRFLSDVCPIYCFVDGDSFFYGFPQLDAMGIKVGKHNNLPVCTADSIDRTVYPHEVVELQAAMNQYLPGSAAEVLSTLTCMYTCTPDEHFIIDRHPKSKNIAYATGCSGHAFKFASVIGEILSELVIDGETSSPIEFLSATRFSR